MVEMGNVWDRTTAFLSDRLGALLPVAIAALLIPHSINTLVGRAGEVVNPAAGAAINLACTLIALWGQLVVVALVLDPEGGRPGALRVATGAYGRSFIAMLALFVAIAVLAVPVVATFVANGVDRAALRSGEWVRDMPTGAAAFLSVYALVLAVLVFVAAIRLSLLYPVIIREGGVIAAIRRAVGLTRGLTWKLIGVWLLFVIVYLVASAAATTAVGAVIGLIAGPLTPFGPGSIVVAILGGLVSTAFTLVTATFSATLYLAVTGTRDGTAPA